MYELIPAGARTYYIDCPAKIGIFLLNEQDVCLIDSGNDKDAARRILKILDANGWTLKTILATHSHADHIGGCAALHARTGCDIFAPAGDLSFTQRPEFAPALLYGGYPLKPLRNKFIMAQPTPACPLTPACLPEGITMLAMDGHCPSMAAYRTADGVWFLGDSIVSDTILEKYHVAYAYNIADYLASMERIKTLTGACFIPSHAPAAPSVADLVDRNIAKVHELAALVKGLCTDASFEDIVAGVFAHYSLRADFGQYALVGSTVRAYLTDLFDRQEITAEFRDNRMLWYAV